MRINQPCDHVVLVGEAIRAANKEVISYVAHEVVRTLNNATPDML